jgi:hypothetical protein
MINKIKMYKMATERIEKNDILKEARRKTAKCFSVPGVYILAMPLAQTEALKFNLLTAFCFSFAVKQIIHPHVKRCQ